MMNCEREMGLCCQNAVIMVCDVSLYMIVA